MSERNCAKNLASSDFPNLALTPNGPDNVEINFKPLQNDLSSILNDHKSPHKNKLKIELSPRSIRSRKDYSNNKANKSGIDFNVRFTMIDTGTPNPNNQNQNIFNGLSTTKVTPPQTSQLNFVSNGPTLPSQNNITERFSTKSFDNTKSNLLRPKFPQNTPSHLIPDLTKGPYLATQYRDLASHPNSNRTTKPQYLSSGNFEDTGLAPSPGLAPGSGLASGSAPKKFSSSKKMGKNGGNCTS